ncbi:MAG: hypothetical protein ACFFD1_02680 [Candidatus Thorarchaeota archaeon]
MNEKIIENTLNEFVKRFQKNPFNYLYEEDIRSELYCYIKAKLKDFLFMKISRVKTDYHYSPDTEIDIAILDDIKNTPDLSKKDGIKSLYRVRVKTAIEIKQQRIDNDQTKPFKEDQIKLENLMKRKNFIESIDTGIAILFFQYDGDFVKAKKFYNGFVEHTEIKIKQKCLNKIIITPSDILMK